MTNYLNVPNQEQNPQNDLSFSFYGSECSPQDIPEKFDPNERFLPLDEPDTLQGKFQINISPLLPKRVALLSIEKASGKSSNDSAATLKTSTPRLLVGDQTPNKNHRVSRRGTLLMDRLGNSRASKIFKIPPTDKSQESSPNAIADADGNKQSIFKPREKGKDLNAMTNEELVDLAIRILKKDPEKRGVKDLLCLSKCVMSVNFFQEMEKDTINKCLRHMYYVSYKAGQTVFEINSVGTTFWVTLRGSVGVWVYVTKPIGVDEQGEQIFENVLTEVKQLPEGSAFGELALLDSKNKRSASIVCKENCEFAVMDKEHFSKILMEKETKKLYIEVDFLASLQIFKSWSYSAIKLLYYSAAVQKYKRGQVLYDEGDSSTKLYIIRAGEVKVLKTIDSKEETAPMRVSHQKKTIEMGIIAEKGIIGEEEMLQGCKRKYKVVCHTLEVDLYEISKTVFHERILKFPQTKAWLLNYVKARETYYQSRLKSICNNNSPIVSPTRAFSYRNLQDVESDVFCFSPVNSGQDQTKSLNRMASAFLRTVPDDLAKSPSARREIHTETDMHKEDDSPFKLALGLRKSMAGSTTPSELTGTEKQQHDHSKSQVDQYGFRIFPKPSQRPVTAREEKTEGTRRKGKIIKLIEVNTNREELMKKPNSPKIFRSTPASADRKFKEAEKSPFYLNERVSTLKTYMPTEESLFTLTTLHTPRTTKHGSLFQDIKETKDSGGNHINETETSYKPSSFQEKVIIERLTKTMEKFPKDEFELNIQFSPPSSSPSLLFYNQVMTERNYSSPSLMNIHTNISREKEQHFRKNPAFVKRFKQIDMMMHHKQLLKPKKKNSLVVQGFGAKSIPNIEKLALSLSIREPVKDTTKIYYSPQQKSKGRNISTARPGSRPKPINTSMSPQIVKNQGIKIDGVGKNRSLIQRKGSVC